MYSELHELRTLAPSVNVIALTATATDDTKATIIDVLRMQSVLDIRDSPNKTNITYCVEYLDNEHSNEDSFGWIAKEIKEGKNEKTIIYCQTIKQCSVLYGSLKVMLGEFMLDSSSLPRLEMLHSCTPQENKDDILDSFGREDGHIQILVATIAFGMGIDCRGVHRTVHFGPSKNIEAFVQETGRAGRDGKPSFSFLLYKGIMLNHAEKDIKEYIKSTECRKASL